MMDAAQVGDFRRSVTLHRLAMAACEAADFARGHGDLRKHREALKKALGLERSAAQLLPLALEPTRSVLFRSAASIAAELSDWSSVRVLVSSAFAGNPPPEIAEELRECLTRIPAGVW